MSLSITSGSVPIPSLNPAGKAKAEKAAQDFEAVLLSSLLENLQKTFAGTSEAGSAGSSTYAQMGAQAMASAMSAHGGIGIARLILQQWRQSKVPEVSAPTFHVEI